MFLKLMYPEILINSTIATGAGQIKTVRIVLPFKHQGSADAVRKQLKNLGKKIGTYLQPVYTGPKIVDKVMLREIKPPLVTNQCVAYIFNCVIGVMPTILITCIPSATFTNALKNMNPLLLEST